MVGLQVNKFEQVSSDDDQMSVSGVGRSHFWYGGSNGHMGASLRSRISDRHL